jgi:hypothetical protein
MKSISRLPVILGMFVALLGVSPRANAADPPKDPCSVLTQEQVSAALGVKAAPGKQVVPTLCAWEVLGQPSGMRSKKLTVGFLKAAAWEQTKALREQIKEFKRTPVSGLGDEAVFSTNGVICTLQVKKGSVVLDMHLYGFAPDQAKEVEIALAREASSKL